MTTSVREKLVSTYSRHLHLVLGSLSFMSSTMLASISGWIYWVVATHRWSNSQIGESTSLVAAMTLIALIAGQPIATTLLARLPRNNDRVALFQAGLVASSILALILSIAGIVVLPNSLHVIRTVGIGILFVVGSVASALGIVVDSSSIAIRAPRIMILRNGLHGFGKLIIITAVSVPWGFISGPFAVILSWSTISVVSSALAIWSWLQKEFERSDELEVKFEVNRRRGWKQLRLQYGAQVLGTLGGTVPPLILPLMVISLAGARTAAWFSITWLIGGLCFMISPAISQAMIADASHEPEKLKEKLRFAIVVTLLLLIVPVIIYLTLGHFVLGIFGTQYAAHGTFLLALLAISTLPDMITNVGIARFRVIDRLWSAASVNVTIAIVVIGSASWLIPLAGINGAGWSWIIGQSAGCVTLVGLLLRDRSKKRFTSSSATN